MDVLGGDFDQFVRDASPGLLRTHGKWFFVGIGGADAEPAEASPIHINGYPGLYGTLRDGLRTIYAPGIGGRGWWVLTMAANTPRKAAVRLIVVPGK